MPERHKDCGSKMFKILVSKIAQFTAIYFLRQPTNQPTQLTPEVSTGGPPPNPAQGGQDSPSQGRAWLLASEQGKQPGVSLTEGRKQIFPTSYKR